jgi:phosphate transport system substrate-binding protein
LLPIIAVVIGIGLLFALPIAGSFMGNKTVKRVCQTIFLTEILIVQFLLLDFEIYLKIGLLIVEFLIIVITVWNLLKMNNVKRIAYIVVLFSMIISVGALDISIRDYYRPESVKPLRYKNYEPFNERNVLATLDEPPDIDFDENYPLPKLDGATAMYPYYAAVYQELYGTDLNMDVYLKCNSSQYAFDKLNERKTDIVFLAGISDDQRENYDFDFTVTPLCKDAFVFIVPVDNPVFSLTTDDLNQIYSGERKYWYTFGGRNTEILLYRLTGQNMGSNIALNEFLSFDVDENLYVSSPQGMGGMVYDVYMNGGGSLGYTYRYFVTDMMERFEVKLLRINEIAPTRENIENGSYPFIKEFIAVNRDDSDNPNVQILIDWLKGPQGQELAEKTGYVPINFANGG